MGETLEAVEVIIKVRQDGGDHSKVCPTPPFTRTSRVPGQADLQDVLLVLVTVQADQHGVTAGHPGPCVHPAHPGQSDTALQRSPSATGIV